MNFEMGLELNDQSESAIKNRSVLFKNKVVFCINVTIVFKIILVHSLRNSDEFNICHKFWCC